MSLALVRPWDWHLPQRLLDGLAMAAAALLIAYGGLLVLVGAGSLLGLTGSAPAEPTALRCHVPFWDPWFLLWGLLLGVAAVQHRRLHHPRPTSTIHRHRSEEPQDMTGHAAVDHSPPDDRSTAQSTPVTVVGLGPMGTALARALLAAGVPTTVWNRSTSRARPLADDGAAVGETLPSAVAASRLVVACLRDHDAFRQAFGQLDPEILDGRTVVHLSSATPDQARETARWATERGISYLNGAIMVPTPLIGTPESLILYSGPASVFEAHEHDLVPLGTADHLGEDPGLASLFDVAMLEVFFAGMTSFLHATAMMTANGTSARTFPPYAERVVAILPDTLAGLARDVDARRHPGDEDNLAMEAAALDHIVSAAADTGTDSRLAVVMRDLARRAVAAGHGADGFSRVVDHLRAG